METHNPPVTITYVPITISAHGSVETAGGSEFISGTELRYADYFEIEYSPRYWALGTPVATIPTTWGKIKSLYSSH